MKNFHFVAGNKNLSETYIRLSPTFYCCVSNFCSFFITLRLALAFYHISESFIFFLSFSKVVCSSACHQHTSRTEGIPLYLIAVGLETGRSIRPGWLSILLSTRPRVAFPPPIIRSSMFALLNFEEKSVARENTRRKRKRRMKWLSENWIFYVVFFLFLHPTVVDGGKGGWETHALLSSLVQVEEENPSRAQKRGGHMLMDGLERRRTEE